MLSTIQTFVKQHRRKFIITSAVIGGSYMLYGFLKSKLIQFEEKTTRQMLEKTRSRHHFETTERTCNQVIEGMSKELSQAILRELGTDELLEQLRQHPSNKIQIWEELKIVAFTRLTTLVYACSMLVIALRIQINLLGGYLYQDVTKDKNQVSDEVKLQYLTLIRFFIHDGGVKQLITLIRSNVSTVLGSISLNKSLTLADIEQIFWLLQMRIDINGNHSKSSTKIAEYLFPTHITEYSSSHTILQQMFLDTFDLLECEDVLHIFSNNICCGFGLAGDMIESAVTDTVRAKDNGQFNNNACHKKSSRWPDFELPMAKLIPIIAKLTSSGCQADEESPKFITAFTSYLISADKNKLLGANVYESFCSA